ncbi:hypothetical protein C0995_014204 [Termitomyces sp. Mi166|nr:hypothetical protein C0995_014204 [Termitomyces sp. Mi166\
MARATRSAKRKRSDDADDDAAPQKQARRPAAPLIAPDHAGAVLGILSMIDTQGLLDRVFPVHGHHDRAASLRTLLAEPQPLSVLRAAVHHLQPISSLPRATPSATATQQHRFCALAADLLNQAAHHLAPLPASLHDILPTSPSRPRPLKYALVQHLPTQDYWTSLNNDTDLSDALKSLPTAHAELVAILPTPAADQSDPVPTLASYASTSNLQSIKPLPQQRTVTTGAFLDFGPWASFAPTFDHDGEVVGRNELALALYARRSKPIVSREEPCGSAEQSAMEVDGSESVDLENELRELFSPEEAAAVKGALDTLELEKAVGELLDRNRRALMRLEHLQVERIIKDGDGSVVEEGSEEWDTAQGILETLTVLASLRPQTWKGAKTIIPPPSILHKLHRTLAISPSAGWHGTLPATRPGALCDDTTYKKSSRAVVPPPAATPTPGPTTASATAATNTTTAGGSTVPVTVTAPVALPYSGYTYAYGQQGQTQPYRPASATGAAAAAGTTNGYTQYAPQYYAYTPPQQGQQQSYYTGQQQGYTAASYSTWYNSLYSAQGGSGSGSGKSTPQPQVQPGTYGSFFGTPGRTPAVANTVYAAAAAAAATATLPPHLRTQQQYYGYPGGK